MYHNKFQADFHDSGTRQLIVRQKREHSETDVCTSFIGWLTPRQNSGFNHFAHAEKD